MQKIAKRRPCRGVLRFEKIVRPTVNMTIRVGPGCPTGCVFVVWSSVGVHVWWGADSARPVRTHNECDIYSSSHAYVNITVTRISPNDERRGWGQKTGEKLF